jgi:hypothetical protein
MACKIDAGCGYGKNEARWRYQTGNLRKPLRASDIPAGADCAAGPVLIR